MLHGRHVILEHGIGDIAEEQFTLGMPDRKQRRTGDLVCRFCVREQTFVLHDVLFGTSRTLSSIHILGYQYYPQK